jgi:uncharacterized protein
MTREFIYMPEFDKQWDKCGLKDLQQREFEAFLCEYPEVGSMIQGTGIYQEKGKAEEFVYYM